MTSKKQKTEYVSVEMVDGRVVQFPVSRQMQRTVLEYAVRFDWKNGLTESFPLPDQHLIAAALSGWGDRLARAAGNLKDEAGKSITDPQAMHDEVVRYAGVLSASPDWNLQGEGTEKGHIVLRAIMAHSGKTLEQAKAFVTEIQGRATPPMTLKAAYAALSASKYLKPIIRQMEDENASEDDTIDAALAGA